MVPSSEIADSIRAVAPKLVVVTMVAQMMTIVKSDTASTADYLYFSQTECAADNTAKVANDSQTASVRLCVPVCARVC